MRLLILIAIAGVAYYIWTNVLGRSMNPFSKNAETKRQKAKILLLLRGNEHAFLRMYEREKASYPHLQEGEILARIADKLANDR